MNERNKSKGTYAEPVCVTSSGETDFERALSQAINEGLASISTIVAPVLRAYLDDAVVYEIGRMRSRSTPKDVKDLERGMEKVFGFGAKVFERKILESLYARLSLTPKTRQNLSFSQAVREAKKAFDSKKNRNKKGTSGKRRSSTIDGTEKG